MDNNKKYTSSGKELEAFYAQRLQEIKDGEWIPITKKEIFEMIEKRKKEIEEENKKNENND